ncbi:plexin domain-containing protein 2-like isoform X2 [Saccostrea echinata]|uniref:plexin domain-containing protein 2-like isoform X2 n=1 Tax=Saccostrea echinata TaxID=191078 RepID=UPI002A80D42D|nr:plexin domain-containing protein 2-like isoform X2 [Saccostrea echinata]
MATTRWVLLESVVIVTFFISSQVELTFSEGVAYSLYNSEPDLDSVISFGQHHNLYKRQSGNSSGSTTQSATTTIKSPTTPLPTTTKEPTTTPNYTEQKLSQHHKYYTSKIITTTAEFPKYWTELYDVKHSEPLSGSHRVAVSVPINFKFKFYGHEVSKVTIATGGFLYMSPFLHQWLTATQYIAPLMANFDTSMNNDSIILYKDFGDKFVVEWQRVFLQDQNHTNPFSFQTTLHSNGTIYFAYRDVPVEVFNIEVKNHPVKVGVSDAFYIDTIQGGVQRRTIYEYHRVEVDFKRVRSQSVVILEPLATCNIAKDCNTCLTQDDSFDCKWCPQVSRCSDGIDWLRQEWRDRGCEIQAFDNPAKCAPPTTESPTTKSQTDIPTKSNTTTMAPKPSISTLKPTTSIPKLSTFKPNTTSTLKPNSTAKLASTPKPTTNTPKPTITSTPVPTTSTPKPTTSTPVPTTSTPVPTTSTPKPTTSTPVPTTSTPVPQSTLVAPQKNGDGCMPGSSRSNCSYKGAQKSSDSATIAGVVVAVIILVALVVGIGGWFFYAYTHPTSASGQWMINHRPSEMKAKMSKMKFWKKDTGSGEKYRVESQA